MKRYFQLGFLIAAAAWGYWNGGGEQIVETPALAVGQWVHVAVVLGGHTAKLYVNGVVKAVNTAYPLNRVI